MSNKGHSGFTLIELLLGVTLSAILMTGIVIFVSSSLGSNIHTKKMLEEGNSNNAFEEQLNITTGNITGSGIYASGSTFGEYLTGIFFSTSWPNLPITFLGLKTETGYCDSYSGTASETGTVLKLALRQLIIPQVQNATSYTLSLTGNSIFSGSTRIIGTGYPGNTLTLSGIDTELSSPSALILSGTHLYIADTMNDRILSYDITSGKIVKLLGAENGIEKPTSLYFSGNTLLMASSGNGKILSLQDGEWDGSAFQNIFRVAKDFSADILRFTFLGSSSVTSPTLPGNFIFNGIIQSSDDTVTTGTGLQYTFSWGTKSFSTGTPYKFTIDSIAPLPINLGNNTVQIDFFSGVTLVYSDIFHHFTKGDGELENSMGNTIKTLSGGFIYPNNITGANTWNSTLNWSNILSANPPGNEILSSLPVRDLTYQIQGKILTLQYSEYKHYDCILGKHQIVKQVRKILLP